MVPKGRKGRKVLEVLKDPHPQSLLANLNPFVDLEAPAATLQLGISPAVQCQGRAPSFEVGRAS